jgi:hypothetical protein
MSGWKADYFNFRNTVCELVACPAQGNERQNGRMAWVGLCADQIKQGVLYGPAVQPYKQERL